MIPLPVHILLIEDNPGDARLIEELVKEFPNGSFSIAVEKTLEQGVQRLKNGSFGIVLLDLGLPDSNGLETFVKLRDQELDLPILVLSGLNDEEVAVKTVHEGAQDYLVKGDFRPDQLYRAIRYALERHSLQSELFAMSLVDSLTNLYNRRGFLKLGRQELKTADRLDHGVLLLFMDLDNMKWINDTLGHNEGDRALRKIADLLRSTFRQSDIIARLGGDEFVVLALNADQDAEIIKGRFQKAIADYNKRGESSYELSMSIGSAAYRSSNQGNGIGSDVPDKLEALLEKADTLMYAEKQAKKQKRLVR
jgi:two-component system, cell cycle response regulator